MGTIKITIQDELGNVIGEIADWESQLDLGKATFAEIEGAVEEFKQRTLAEIEKKLLLAAQAKFVEKGKKAGSSSVMGRQ
jgi:hypothetical protein